ncbi:MAG: type I-E CRISPR-associated endoribonuclease Cas2e [Eubacteriaceae bacterium]|nr:type I-E CRISPR-associated endoribonuclease Cas2e [Eubacteriaceae bacterium]
MTKWLCEISTGVFVGNMNARVRDEVWERIKKYIGSGKATMVFTTNNEQGYEFKIIGDGWLPIDYDGLKLVMRPRVQKVVETSQGYSKASKFRMAEKRSKSKTLSHSATEDGSFVVIDIETTGLDPKKDSIIMISAIKASPDAEDKKFETLVIPDVPIPQLITRLTGITAQMVESEGISLDEAMKEFLSFIDDLKIVAYNVKFDIDFINAALVKSNQSNLMNETVDVLALSKDRLKKLKNYKLITVANHFGINITSAHNASSDCIATKEIYEKLMQ